MVDDKISLLLKKKSSRKLIVLIDVSQFGLQTLSPMVFIVCKQKHS